MVYYEIKNQYDNCRIYQQQNGYRTIVFFVVGGELFTEKEKISRNIPDKWCIKREIKKTETYKLFGVRFPFIHAPENSAL